MATLLLALGSTLMAQEDGASSVQASPKRPWGVHILLWPSNRLMDFVDIFRVDFGVGPSYGAVVRISKYGQLGYRAMAPTSVRMGDFGRKAPFIVESSNEYGVGPRFVNSKDRKVCPGEFGAGVDVLIAGGYGAICVEEFFDFAAGLFFIDVMDDDAK